MKKSAIVTLTLSIILLVAGVGLIVFGMNGGFSQPEVRRYSDDFGLFSWSWSYAYSSFNSYRVERFFELGRTLITCGVILLGFTFVLEDGNRKAPKAGKSGKASSSCCHEAHYEDVDPSRTEAPKSEGTVPGTGETVQAEEQKKDDVIHL